MAVVFTHGAALDVQKQSVPACRIVPAPPGAQAEGLAALEILGTMTRELLALADWLATVGMTHEARASTGEYWQPVDNLLEGPFAVILVHAAHVKHVPGRKTDKADARWLATLMRSGLLQASCIPPEG